jgi:hypothetical protein
VIDAAFQTRVQGHQAILSEVATLGSQLTPFLSPEQAMAVTANLLVCRAKIYFYIPTTCNKACQMALKAIKEANNEFGVNFLRMTVWTFSGSSFATANQHAQAIKCYKKAIDLAAVGPDGSSMKERWALIASESKKDVYASLRSSLLVKFGLMLESDDCEQISKLPHMAWCICANAKHVYTYYMALADTNRGHLARELSPLPDGAEKRLVELADHIEPDQRYYYLQQLLIRVQLSGEDHFHAYLLKGQDNCLSRIINDYGLKVHDTIGKSMFCSAIFADKPQNISLYKWAQAALDTHGYATTPTKMQVLFNKLDKNDVRGKTDVDVLKKLLG